MPNLFRREKAKKTFGIFFCIICAAAVCAACVFISVSVVNGGGFESHTQSKAKNSSAQVSSSALPVVLTESKISTELTKVRVDQTFFAVLDVSSDADIDTVVGTVEYDPNILEYTDGDAVAKYKQTSVSASDDASSDAQSTVAVQSGVLKVNKKGAQGGKKCTINLNFKVKSAGTSSITFKSSKISGDKSKSFSQSTASASLETISSDPDKKTVYLTFDDGCSQRTPDILKLLNKYNAHATFFLINSSYNKYIKDIYDQGSAVAIHSYTHEYSKIYKSADDYFKDLYKMSAVIEKQIGFAPKLVRMPGGSSNTVSMSYCKGVVTDVAQRMESEGYTYTDWNVDSTDANGNGIAASKIIWNVEAGCRNVDAPCVLMHDTNAKRTTYEALPDILKDLTDKGYNIAAMTSQTPPVHHRIAN